MTQLNDIDHQSLLNPFAEYIGRGTLLSAICLKIIAFISVAQVNEILTVLMSSVGFIYICIKAYNERLITKKLKDKDKPSA